MRSAQLCRMCCAANCAISSLKVERHSQSLPEDISTWLATEPTVFTTCGEAYFKSSIASEDGKELILRLHKPRDILGELCFCDGRRREQAVAMEDSEIIQIPLDDLI